MKFSFFIFVVLRLLVSEVSALLPGLYCGEENCYDVLDVTRDSSKAEIAKSYRKLAAKYHPDKQRGSEADLKRAEEKFRSIAVAYETLKDDESRNDYDYMLDHPDEVYRNYYYYYRHRVAPKVDVRIVIVGTIVAISLVQYISAWHKYNEAISYLLTQPKYRLKAVEIAKKRGLVRDSNQKKGKKRRDKDEAKEEEETIIKSIIEENIDVRGGYKKPSLFDVLLYQIIIFPYTSFIYCKWYARWLWKFTINKEELGDEEKNYLIRRNLKLSQNQFDCLEEPERRDYYNKKLWIKETFLAWQKEKEEEERIAKSESGAYKRYRRYMKNHGPGQISFLED